MGPERFQYQKTRYLRHLSDEELYQRGREAYNATMRTTLEGKMSLLPIKGSGSIPIQRFQHYISECSLRGIDFPEAMAHLKVYENLPDPLDDNGRRAAKAIREFKAADKAQLFKFGKGKYLSPLLNEGKLRIQPASSFASPQHNAAVGDTETTRSFKVSVSEADLQNQLTADGSIVNAQLEFTISSFTDYWMTCFGKSLQPRMAVDFEADSMLVVYNTEEFRRRLRKAVRSVTNYSKMGHGAVKYFDPYLPNCDIQNIPLIKPFKYYYQHEFRYYWLPIEPVSELKFIEVEMGSLHDICDLVAW